LFAINKVLSGLQRICNW